MANFADSLKKGVKAAKDYDKHQKEIQAIFDELEKSIKKFTNNKIGVAKAPNSATFKSTKELIKATKASTNFNYRNGSIFLYSKDDTRMERIADWHQADTDFSFSLVYEGKQIITKSTEQLKSALGQLLESPSVGSVLISHDKSLSALEAKPAAKTAVKTSRNSAGNITKQAVKSTSKPSTAKPVAKRATTKPAEKPAKPAKRAKKPVAKRPAAKPAKPGVKPTAANKPAAKSVVKLAPKERAGLELAN